jgi:hypothetical protein
MNNTVKNYDPGCLELAERFVSVYTELSADDKAKLADELATDIQNTIEMTTNFRMTPCDFCGAPRARGSHSNCVLF